MLCNKADRYAPALWWISCEIKFPIDVKDKDDYSGLLQLCIYGSSWICLLMIYRIFVFSFAVAGEKMNSLCLRLINIMEFCTSGAHEVKLMLEAMNWCATAARRQIKRNVNNRIKVFTSQNCKWSKCWTKLTELTTGIVGKFDFGVLYS